MRKLLFLLALVFAISVNAQDVNYTREGNNFTQVSTRTKSVGEQTKFTWTTTDGTVYPVYITATGRCYILKVSKKTGKEYKMYLKADVSKQICSELGREYKELEKK